VRAKASHCVERKHRVQDRLHAEYEARKDEFASEVRFLKAKADESGVAKVIRAKIASARAARGG
jgi:hypothetical protein